MKLQSLIEQYLGYRKALGWRDCTPSGHLGGFGRFLGADADVTDVREEHVRTFLAGAGPLTSTWHTKYAVLRSFYRYAVSRGYVAAIPLPTAIPKRPPRFVPYIYPREELQRLFRAVDAVRRRRDCCLEPLTMRAILVLLYGAGLRIQEALDLLEPDVDLNGCLLTVRPSKFAKTRLVPIGPQLARALAPHARARARGAETPFFATRGGGRIRRKVVEEYFRILCNGAGIRRDDGACRQPRLHDLRHTFAVHRLTAWYQQGADVQKLLPQLATYLGHVTIQSTQVYLSMTPELLGEACKRFERYAAEGACHA
jgi:integrase/recombinase XerD